MAQVNETITRNHQCRGMANLLARVKHFMDTVSPFPGMAMAQRRVPFGISYLELSWVSTNNSFKSIGCIYQLEKLT